MTFTEDKTVADAYAELKLAYESGVNFFDNSESYGETSQGWVRGGVSEVIMGQAVQLGIKEKLWDRMDLVISTKLMWGGRGTLDTPNSVGLSRKHLVEGMHASLERMQLSYVDLVSQFWTHINCCRLNTPCCIYHIYCVSTLRGTTRNVHYDATLKLVCHVCLCCCCKVFCHRPDSRTPIWETCRAMNFLIDQGLAFCEWAPSIFAPCSALRLIVPRIDCRLGNLRVVRGATE